MDIFDITGLGAPSGEVDIDRLTEELERLRGEEGVTIHQVGHDSGMRPRDQAGSQPVHRPSWGGRLEATPMTPESSEGLERFRCGSA